MPHGGASKKRRWGEDGWPGVAIKAIAESNLAATFRVPHTGWSRPKLGSLMAALCLPQTTPTPLLCIYPDETIHKRRDILPHAEAGGVV